MTKTETVNQIKRANNRLKVVGETCLRIAQQRDSRPPDRVQKQLTARLDRELTKDDTAGPALREAVEVFWREFYSGADSDRQFDLASEVYVQVRFVQQGRWRQVEAKHGKVRHYFDRFGQVKARYRRTVEETDDEGDAASPSGFRWLLLLVVLAGLAVWWLW
jgi:hypothetical protein